MAKQPIKFDLCCRGVTYSPWVVQSGGDYLAKLPDWPEQYGAATVCEGLIAANLPPALQTIRLVPFLRGRLCFGPSRA
jgi:hypothetical protein